MARRRLWALPRASIAGLATVTPASGFVGPMAALAIGAAAGLACYGGVLLKAKLGYDEPWTRLACTGWAAQSAPSCWACFALRVWNPGGGGRPSGGNAAFFGKQLLAVGVGIGYAVCGHSGVAQGGQRGCWFCGSVPKRSTRAWTSTCTARKATTWAWVSRRKAASRPLPSQRPGPCRRPPTGPVARVAKQRGCYGRGLGVHSGWPLAAEGEKRRKAQRGLCASSLRAGLLASIRLTDGFGSNNLSP